MPVLVNGWVLSSETHAFRFNAKSGQKIVCRVQSQEINPMMANAVPGWPQMVLTLFDDRDGRQLAYDDRFRFKPDPVIICDIPHDGTYRIEIRDSLFRGRENFIYRLSIGALPLLTDIFPLGGSTTKPCCVSLTGVNLPGSSLAVTPTRPGDILPVAVKSSLLSNSLPFQLDDLPEVVCSESPAPQRIAVPAIVNGRITRAGQEDVLTFHAAAREELVFEVFARRLDSPLDSVLTLTDAKGNRLAQNDDFIDDRFPLLTHQAEFAPLVHVQVRRRLRYPPWRHGGQLRSGVFLSPGRLAAASRLRPAGPAG